MKRSRVLLLTLVALACSGAVTPAADGWGVAILPSGRQVQLELAIENETRARGYMYREHVGPDEGMLFVFPRNERHTMWMKNCRVSLDMLWLDEDFRINEILSDRPPCPPEGECPIIDPMRGGRYVLELAAGSVVREKLALGQRLMVLDDRGEPIRP